jgi:copper(I)-binding protein
MSDDSMSDDSMSDDSMSDDSESDEDMSDDSMGDVAMTMQPVDALEIPASGQVSLAPGGFHVMLLDLVNPLEVGQTFDVTFTEDTGDEFTVTAEVRDEAP